MTADWEKKNGGKPGFVRLLERARDLLVLEKERLIDIQKKAEQMALQTVRDKQHRQSKAGK